MNELTVVDKAAEWRRMKSLVLDSVSSPITKRVYIFLGGIYPDSLLFGGRFVLTMLQGCQSSVDLIDRKIRRSTPTRICAHLASTLSLL
jgi:hypothetical protein